MSSTINFYAYLAAPPERIVLSTYSTLDELEGAIACAPALKLTHVVIHIGMQPMAEGDVLKDLQDRQPGTYVTTVAGQVIPRERLPAAVALNRPSNKQGVNASGASRKPHGTRVGAKTNPNSALSRGRILFAAMYPASKDVEIKRRMVEELGINMQVANTYFCKFRDEQAALEAEVGKEATIEAAAP